MVRRPGIFLNFWLTVALAFWVPGSRAESPSLESLGPIPPSNAETEFLKIPRVPSAPPAITRKTAEEFPHCERFFLYRGKKIECDSNLGNDGERLRSIMRDVPPALAELDIYQANQNKIRNVAYVGTAGLLTIILGSVVTRTPFDPVTGSPRFGGYAILGGALAVVNSLIYGLSMVKVNESHLGRAVDHFNQAHPDSPIELKFSTEVNF